MSIKTRHPEKVNKPVNPIKKKPEWIRSKIVDSKIFFEKHKDSFLTESKAFTYLISKSRPFQSSFKFLASSDTFNVRTNSLAILLPQKTRHIFFQFELLPDETFCSTMI